MEWRDLNQQRRMEAISKLVADDCPWTTAVRSGLTNRAAGSARPTGAGASFVRTTANRDGDNQFFLATLTDLFKTTFRFSRIR